MILKENIIEELRRRGCRITAQRKLILDTILEENCSCCKEVYYEVIRKDASIGIATVYRMIRTLEEIGSISRRQVYQVTCEGQCVKKENPKVFFEDGEGEIVEIKAGEWYDAMKAQLLAEGLIQEEGVSVMLKKDVCCKGVDEDDRLYCWN